MKPAPFAYAKAKSFDHLFDLVEEHGDDARILAGGQSLVAMLNMRLAAPTILIDIGGFGELEEIALEDGWLCIGALARHQAVARSPLVAQHAPLVARAMPHIAHPAIRNRGTFGGSIALADPAAELPACILALEAEIETAARSGRRRIAAADFFKDLYETDLKPGEIVTAIRLPPAEPGSRAGFAEIARRTGDYAIVGLAAVGDEALRDVRLAYFGVGATPLRARAAERALADGSAERAVEALREDLDPPDDIAASGAMRRHLAGVLLKRVLKEMRGEDA